MDRQLSDRQKARFFDILDTAMKVLREDDALSTFKSLFEGPSRSEVESDSLATEYSFESNALPNADIKLFTSPDPLNYADDRHAIPVVPVSFQIRFFSSIYGVDRSALEKRLSLEPWWVDSDGIEHDGNSLPSLPPAIRLHAFRYRARELPTSRFPVNVEVFYIDPDKDDVEREPRLDEIRINRAYPYLTPEMRKQKRDEAAARAQNEYGNGASK
ncbi:hypothetical protein [Paraburkholderia bannensis]|uniref:hypothetical protein n=1 Tax=Paraburkholderia bannensis TaxID=765414 RepID=UPI002AC32ED6|nr:hypothetical protein [Paraburkholderia bannensis]